MHVHVYSVSWCVMSNLIGDIKYYNDTVSSSVVTRRYRPESLLTCCVPLNKKEERGHNNIPPSPPPFTPSYDDLQFEALSSFHPILLFEFSIQEMSIVIIKGKRGEERGEERRGRSKRKGKRGREEERERRGKERGRETERRKRGVVSAKRTKSTPIVLI